MNHKISIGVMISIVAIACALTFILTSFFSLQSFNAKVQDVKEKAAKYDRLEALDTYVRARFYQKDIDEEQLMDGMLKGYVAGLGDPYSRYLSAEEFDELVTKEAGLKSGIGIYAVLNDDGNIRITRIEEDGPADEAGIEPGDIITAVNGEPVTELGYSDAVENLRGEEGTDVQITFLRNGLERKINITRRYYDVRTVFYQMLDGQIGYIRITNFRENTAEQFQQALDEMLGSGARYLLFDVRGNTGGLLKSLEKMLDPLLPEGVIATATYQDGKTETAIYSDASETDLPMAVLVDGGSASAAELFAASLRDFGKAKLVGTTTFGKGVMQTTQRLEDGGGLTLTVATYQTTVSECYHGVGLTPDLEVEPGENVDPYEIDRETDPQLAAGIDLLLGWEETHD
ncbi:MAG: S41 family peptidase [Oscillospiraceae bacterium]|nr:S41 family peptidase [Oscillospiraceae bacterium]